MTLSVYWAGQTPKHCALCNDKLLTGFYDARIPAVGSWGTICYRCFNQHGCKTGTGMGQRFVQQRDGSFLKTEG